MKTHAIHTCVSLLQTDMIQQQIRFLKWNTRDKKRNLIKTMGYLHSFELVGFLSLFKLSYLQSQQIKQETNTGGFIVKLCSLILSSKYSQRLSSKWENSAHDPKTTLGDYFTDVLSPFWTILLFSFTLKTFAL